MSRTKRYPIHDTFENQAKYYSFPDRIGDDDWWIRDIAKRYAGGNVKRAAKRFNGTRFSDTSPGTHNAPKYFKRAINRSIKLAQKRVLYRAAFGDRDIDSMALPLFKRNANWRWF
jgi:hypothetical protein